MKELSPRQKKFADLHLEGLPAKQAYLSAGYATCSSGANASLLLGNPKVAAYIAEQREILNAKSLLTKEQIMSYLTHIILTPIGQLDGESPLAQEYSCDPAPKGGIRKRVKMIGKMEAVKQLCNMMGWNAAQQHELQASGELAEIIRRARAGEGKKGTEGKEGT